MGIADVADLGHLRRESEAAPGARRDVSGVARWVDDMRTMLLARRTRPVELESLAWFVRPSSTGVPLDVLLVCEKGARENSDTTRMAGAACAAVWAPRRG